MDAKGYAMVTRGTTTRKVHRIAYQLAHGPVPCGLVLDHLCRVRHCVNVEHLEAVTNAENVRRGSNTKLTMEAARAIRVVQPA